MNVDVTMAATSTSMLTKSEVQTKAKGIATEGRKLKAKWTSTVEEMLANVLGGHF